MTAGWFPSTWFPTDWFPEDWFPDYGVPVPGSGAFHLMWTEYLIIEGLLPWAIRY